MSQYSKAVDAHIYAFQCAPDPQPGCKTPEDWIELAIAALDQAGMSVKNQDCVEKLVRNLLDVEAQAQ